MPSLATVAGLFKDIWNDFKEEGTANLSTFAYFLFFLIFFIIVMAFSYYPTS
ncbi:MAG: hypothetical protein JXQ83_02670 [Candidatus Glassbacteria bacterium]|nr:hypothetical protein [Candidatus Glassbacteria bacterium]